MGLIVPAIPEGASLGELEGAAEAIREAIARLVAEGAGGGEPSRCPRCGCERFVRKGRDAGGAQRYLCRGCGRTGATRRAVFSQVLLAEKSAPFFRVNCAPELGRAKS